MCLVSKPKIKKSDAEDQKDPAILRNPILDGMLGNIAALRGGRNSLRINLANPLAIPVGGGVGGSLGGSGTTATSGSMSSYNPPPTGKSTSSGGSTDSTITDIK